MEKSVPSSNKTLNSDSWWQAFISTKVIIESVVFDVQSAGSSDTVLVSVSPGTGTNVTTGDPSKADFVLAAKPAQWERLFAKDQKAPYMSFVGLQVWGGCCREVSHKLKSPVVYEGPMIAITVLLL